MTMFRAPIAPPPAPSVFLCFCLFAKTSYNRKITQRSERARAITTAKFKYHTHTRIERGHARTYKKRKKTQANLDETQPPSFLYPLSPDTICVSLNILPCRQTRHCRFVLVLEVKHTKFKITKQIACSLSPSPSFNHNITIRTAGFLYIISQARFFFFCNLCLLALHCSPLLLFIEQISLSAIPLQRGCHH